MSGTAFRDVKALDVDQFVEMATTALSEGRILPEFVEYAGLVLDKVKRDQFISTTGAMWFDEHVAQDGDDPEGPQGDDV